MIGGHTIVFIILYWATSKHNISKHKIITST